MAFCELRSMRLLLFEISSFFVFGIEQDVWNNLMGLLAMDIRRS